MKKTCIKCNNTKDVSEFNIRKDSKDGYRNACKICTMKKNKENYHTKYGKEYSAKMYKRHRKAALKHKKEIYDPVEKKKYNQEYFKINKEVIRKQGREYYKNNREEILRKKREIHIPKKPPITTESVILKFQEIHKDKYDYSHVIYKGSAKRVKIICKEHGEFEQLSNDHMCGAGCPSCKIGGFNQMLSAIVYYIKINGGEAYKIGITNKTVNERFLAKELKEIEVLQIWEYEIGKDALRHEQEILNTYKYAKYKGTPLLRNGNSELFDRDILNLDKKNPRLERP